VAELERELRGLAAELEWPPTPPVVLRLEPQRHRVGRRRAVWLALAVAAVALVAAMSVPASRSAILRVLHLGGVTVEKVDVLPPAQQRPLAADLGPEVDVATAQAALGSAVRLPRLDRPLELHLRQGVVSALLETPAPVLLSEFRANAFVLKKIAGSATSVEWLRIGRVTGLWITGARHLVALPAVPPRLAGNVLLWQSGPITYRLEGKSLDRQAALRLAAEIEGT